MSALNTSPKLTRYSRCYVSASSLIFMLLMSCEDPSPSPSTQIPLNADQSTAQSMAGYEASAGEPHLSGEDRALGDPSEEGAGALALDLEAGVEMSGAEMSLSGETAGSASAGVERRPASCLISCAEFVECAIKQCPGYDEPDDALLMEECLGACTPTIAELFDRVSGCAEKLRFASTVRTDFLDFCDSESDGFCETYIATCGAWLGEGPCEDHYNLAPREGARPDQGAHQLCYEYHLGAAMVALEEDNSEAVTLGCERAAGLSMCVAE